MIESSDKLSVSLRPKPVLTVTRTSLSREKLIYILVCNEKRRYHKGSSKVVYIGRTEKGIARIAKSAAYRADKIFGKQGVTTFEARVVTFRKRRGEKSRTKLERAFLLAFKELYGELPLCNEQLKRKRTTDEFTKYFNKRQLQHILKKLGTR